MLQIIRRLVKAPLLRTSSFLAILSLFSMNSAQASSAALGMGFTGVAYPQDSQAGLYNPAGMVDVGDRFDVSGLLYHQTGNTEIKGNADPVLNGKWNNSRFPLLPGGELGINYMLSDRMSIGVVLGTRAPLIKTTYSSPVFLAGTTRLGAELVQLVISPIFSMKLSRCHSIGIGINIGVQRAKVEGFQNFDTPEGSGFPGYVTNRGYDSSAGVGFSLGWQGELFEDFTAGLRFDSRTWMTRLKNYEGFSADRASLDYPCTIALGLAYKLLPQCTVAADVNYLFMHEIKAYGNPIYPNILTSKLGLKNGPGHGFRNIWQFHLGADYAIGCSAVVRAGWMYNKSPVRRSQTLGNLHTLTIVENILTAGGTWKFARTWEATLGYAHGFHNKVSGRNSISPLQGGGECILTQQFDVYSLTVGSAF